MILLALAPMGVCAAWLAVRRLRRRRPVREPTLQVEGNAIIAQEWDLVRRGRCQPSGCPRAIGSPLRPRKDDHCEICAAMFLDRYWTRLLRGPEAPAQRRSRHDHGAASAERPELVPLIPLGRHRLLTDREPSCDTAARRSGRRTGTRVLVRLGLATTAAGGLLVAATPWIEQGCILIGAGLVCLAGGALCP